MGFDELDHVKFFCEQQSPPLRIVEPHPKRPGGPVKEHWTEALVSGPNHGLIAVEVTRAFQGPRVGRASIQQDKVEFRQHLEEKIGDTIHRQRVKDTEFVEVGVVLAPGIDAFLDEFAQTRPIRWALDTVFGHCIDPVLKACAASRRSGAPELCPPLGGGADFVQHVQGWVRSSRLTSRATVPVRVDIRGLVLWDNGGRTDEIWPLYVGIDSEGIVQAVYAKAKRNLGGYRKVATDCGIRDVWLLVVADGSPHTTLMCTPQVTVPAAKERVVKMMDERRKLNQPVFDRIILIMSGYWVVNSISSRIENLYP